MSRITGKAARRHRARFALGACLVLATWAGAAGSYRAGAQETLTDPPPDVPSGFVTVAGGEFQLDGRQFRHIGVNTSGLLYESDAQALTDLDGMQRSGIKQVRVFLANDQRTPQQIGDRLQWLLDRAQERDIRVTLPFTDYYGGIIWAWSSPDPPPPPELRPRHRVQGDATYYTVCIDHCGTRDAIMVLNPAWFASGY